MRNEQLVNNFLMGETKGKASNLEIRGDSLVNYETTIAQRVNGVIVINVTKYSASTTRIQNLLRKEMPKARTVEGVPMGTKDLTRYL